MLEFVLFHNEKIWFSIVLEAESFEDVRNFVELYILLGMPSKRETLLVSPRVEILKSFQHSCSVPTTKASVNKLDFF